ncbi:MAG: hypothetical protein IPJ34_43380 [Myxococcales bacterium]|nr:hypothetical protein [Myxococcales bacterium]
METVRARVRNGRLVLDEPTDLPEGTEIELAHVTDDDSPWDLSAERMTELQQRIASADRGEVVDGDVVLARLRAAR